MKTYGIIGYPLSHSFSPKYFTEKFKKEGIVNAEYKAFELKTIQELPQIIKENPALCGLNVTIPYKEMVIPVLDELDETAKAVGAVNTIKIDINDSKLTGYNTDVYGFQKSLEPHLKPHHANALILGTGGAAKAVAYVLGKLNINFRMVSRSPRQIYEMPYQILNQQLMQLHQIIINTTPLGMSPKTDEYPPILYEYLTEKHLLYDLIYNPEKTLFLKMGEEKGASIINGQQMLEFQAEKSWEIWNND